MTVESLRNDENPIVSKLGAALHDAVESVLDAHPSQITYQELIGTIEMLKADYVSEAQDMFSGAE